MSRRLALLAVLGCGCVTETWSSNGLGGSFLAEGSEVPLVEARLNGQGPFSFVVDTGAGVSMVSPKVAARLGLSIGRTVRMSGVVAAEAAHLVTVQTVETGGITATQVPMVVGEIFYGVDGLLGHDFLSSLNVTIDYRAHRVTFERAAPAPDGGP